MPPLDRAESPVPAAQPAGAGGARPEPLASTDEIETWLAELLEGPPGAEAAALEELCRAHPAQAAELRGRWHALTRLQKSLPAAAREAFPARLGDFRLLRRLGGGGMGVVYLAHQESLGREVALKLIRPEQLYFPGARARFRREVEAVARLQHPGIVPVFTVGEEQGIPFFAMERVEGCTLAEVLEELKDRRPEQLSGRDLAAAVGRRTGVEAAAEAFEGSWAMVALRVAREVAEALAHAHERGVIHRDVKPSNVMLTPRGRVLVLDFGLALAEGSARLTLSSATLGSQAYMPPEQARGENRDPGATTDVYSLGVTLYELLTLRLPYLSESSEETRRLVLDAKPPSLRSLNPAVARDAETLCLKAMDPDARRRYPTAAALARDLRNVLELRPIEARRPGPGLRALRFAQRRPALSTALLLGFLLAVVVPTGFALYEQAKREEADRKQYAANLLAASASLYGHETREARRLLESTPADLRGWEWEHLEHRCDDSLAILRQGQAGAVLDLAFSADGSRLVTAGRGALDVWESAAGRVAGTLRLPAELAGAEVVSVALSRDGGRIAGGLDGGRLLVWDALSGELGAAVRAHPPHPITGQAAVLGLAFSPDGGRLISGSWNGEVRAWDLATDGPAVLLRDPGGKRINCIDLDAAGARIAAGSADGHLRILDARTGALLAELRDGAADIRALAFSPDGSRIASASDDTLVRLWDLATGERQHVLRGHAREVSCTAFSPDGTLLATGALDRTVRVWDAGNGDLLALHWGHDESVNALAFSPDGARIASGSEDATLRVWDAQAMDVVLRTWVLSMALGADGATIVTGTWNGRVQSWDAATGAPLLDLPGDVQAVLAVALSPDGRWIAAGGAGEGRIGMWDATSGVRAARFQRACRDVRALAFAPDGRRLACAGEETVWVLDAASGAELLALRGHAGPVTSVAFSPDGRRIASGSEDGRVRTWEAATGAELAVLAGHEGRVLRVAFSRDGRRLAAGGEGRIVRVWDVASARSVAELRAHEQAVGALAYSPDDRRLVSGARDGSVRVWDARSFELLCILRGHSKDVLGLCFTPDGARLLSASSDQTVRTWDTPAARRGSAASRPRAAGTPWTPPHR